MLTFGIDGDRQPLTDARELDERGFANRVENALCARWSRHGVALSGLEWEWRAFEVICILNVATTLEKLRNKTAPYGIAKLSSMSRSRHVFLEFVFNKPIRGNLKNRAELFNLRQTQRAPEI